LRTSPNLPAAQWVKGAGFAELRTKKKVETVGAEDGTTNIKRYAISWSVIGRIGRATVNQHPPACTMKNEW